MSHLNDDHTHCTFVLVLVLVIDRSTSNAARNVGPQRSVEKFYGAFPCA